MSAIVFALKSMLDEIDAEGITDNAEIAELMINKYGVALLDVEIIALGLAIEFLKTGPSTFDTIAQIHNFEWTLGYLEEWQETIRADVR